MKTTLCIIALFLLAPPSTTAQQPGFQDPLLDLLAGNWVMTGTIAGAETTHDIVAEWVLERNVESAFVPYDREANLKAFQTFLERWGDGVSTEDARELMRIFDGFKCAP